MYEPALRAGGSQPSLKLVVNVGINLTVTAQLRRIRIISFAKAKNSLMFKDRLVFSSQHLLQRALPDRTKHGAKPGLQMKRVQDSHRLTQNI